MKTRPEKYLDAKARGMLLDVQRTLSAVLEIFHTHFQDSHEQELRVFQSCFAALEKCNSIFALINDDQKWYNLDFNAKVDLITELELNFPFKEGGGGFGGAFGPKVRSEYLEKAVKRCLFPKKSSKPEITGKKRKGSSFRKATKRFKEDFTSTEIKALANQTASKELQARFAKHWGIDSKGG